MAKKVGHIFFPLLPLKESANKRKTSSKDNSIFSYIILYLILSVFLFIKICVLMIYWTLLKIMQIKNDQNDWDPHDYIKLSNAQTKKKRSK